MQRIVIIGATSAIAHAAARLWAERGAGLFLVGRDAVRLEANAADLKVRGAASVVTHVMDATDDAAHATMLAAAIERLGFQAVQLSCDLDLSALRQALEAAHPDVIFNLFESLDGSDQLAFIVAALLDHWGVPYTGSPATALFLTNDKLLAKQRLREAGLPTPDWLTDTRPGMARCLDQTTLGRLQPDAQFLLKAITEHASVGMDDGCLVVFRDAQGNPLDVDLVTFKEVIPGGLARRIPGDVHASVGVLTEWKDSAVEFRVLDFEVVD